MMILITMVPGTTSLLVELSYLPISLFHYTQHTQEGIVRPKKMLWPS